MDKKELTFFLTWFRTSSVNCSQRCLYWTHTATSFEYSEFFNWIPETHNSFYTSQKYAKSKLTIWIFSYQLAYAQRDCYRHALKYLIVASIAPAKHIINKPGKKKVFEFQSKIVNNHINMLLLQSYVDELIVYIEDTQRNNTYKVLLDSLV